jgi:hypothetical protein
MGQLDLGFAQRHFPFMQFRFSALSLIGFTLQVFFGASELRI